MVAVARTGCIDRLPDLRCKSVEQCVLFLAAVVSFTTATWICLHLPGPFQPKSKKSESTLLGFKSNFIKAGTVARSLDDASNRLLSTFEYAKEFAAGISLQSMMANLPKTRRRSEKLQKLPSEALPIETSRPSHNPKKVCHQVPIQWKF